jgi:DNA-binding transcriptional MerR regulator
LKLSAETLPQNMPYREKEIEKKYYSIGEVAGMFGVAASLIRFWETEFPNLAPKKGKAGNRLYTAKDIENFKLVYHLVKEKGYTIQGAREALKSKGGQIKDTMEVVEALERVRDFLMTLKIQLDKPADASAG